MRYISHFTFHVLRIVYFPIDHRRFRYPFSGSSWRYYSPFYLLLILLLTCCLFAPLSQLMAQDASPPVEKPAEIPPEARETPLKKLNPEDTTPEKGTLLGDGEQVIMANNRVQIHGSGLIKYEDIVLRADHIWADFNENVMRASGNVRLVVGNEETFADELIYNLKTKKGIVRDGFTYNDPWYYRGSEIFKVEDDESYIRGGSLTSCSLKYPHYYFSASQIIVKLDRELIAKHVLLKVGGVPLFYFPVYRRDIRKNKIAKIIVKLGTDSYQGPFLSVILPLVRRHRYDGALLLDQTARRGRGSGFEGKYRVNDAKYQEIFIPVPSDATPGEQAKFEEMATELSDRLQGEYDRYKLRQIFLEYQINEADVQVAREKAEGIYAQLQAENENFAQIAQAESDHQETRYQGGDMGFLVRGERDAEGALRLPPVLEDAVFQLQEGGMTPILRTEFAFHILKADRILDVYGKREIRVRRIDIAIQPSSETRTAIQETAKEIQTRASAGESFAQLAAAYPSIEVSEVEQPLNEMDRRWRYSVRRLEHAGEVTQTVQTDRGVYIFQLIEKEPTPTFEELGRQFEAKWADLQKENAKTESEKDGTKEEGNRETSEQRNTKPESPEDQTPDVIPNTETGEIVGEPEGEAEKEAVEVYQKHGFQGRWEEAPEIFSQAQRLYNGESSRTIKTPKGYHLIKVDKKRTYRGDVYFYTQDMYSYDRQNPFKTGQEWLLRWGHNQSIYTPWDSREKGRRPLSFVGRVAWQAKYFKEGFGTSESTINSFGVFTWGSAFSALDLEDADEEGNLRFSTKTIGEFLGRLQVNHTLDLTGQGTTTLQKLPQLDISFSRMRLEQLPLFKTMNSGMTWVAAKLHSDLPVLSMFAFPTLMNTSFDIDISFGNFFRQRFRDEHDIFLQTLDLGFDVRKQSTLKVTPNRELRLDLNFDSHLIWHDKDQLGNRNILRGVYDTQIRASNILFRIYDISFIPGARRMRHQIETNVTFDYAPPVDRNDNLYPFGPSTFFFETKRLSLNFDTSIEVKTRRSQSPLRVLSFDSRLTADFTKFEALDERRYEPIESRITIVPLASRNLNIRLTTRHDPNRSEIDGKRFKQVLFQSNVSYRRKRWSLTFGNAFNKLTTRTSRRINGSFWYRPNPLLEINYSVNYDWIERQIYSQNFTIRRNLHDWNMTISWYRVGIKRDQGDNVRQDFVFQINLVDEPAASVGFGYDATTDTWGFRSLPAGVPYNAFGAGNSLGRSYF